MAPREHLALSSKSANLYHFFYSSFRAMPRESICRHVATNPRATAAGYSRVRPRRTNFLSAQFSDRDAHSYNQMGVSEEAIEAAARAGKVTTVAPDRLFTGLSDTYVRLGEP